MRLIKKLPANIFSLLLIVAGVAFVFRAVNIATYSEDSVTGVFAPARAQQESAEQPPPLTDDDIARGIRDTAAALNAADTAAADGGPDGIQPPSGTPADALADLETRAFSAAEIEVLQSLSRRREEIEKREQRLDAREALLQAGEQEVDRKIAELNNLRAEIETLLGQQQTMEEERIASLVKIYENMKPKDAAAIFNTLDMDVLLSVISRMAERKSSPIIAAMNTDRARLVTIRLAELRKLPDAAKPATPRAGAGR